MWWNPHGEMMCSATGWQSRGEGLTMSAACWTMYMFRTAAPVCQHRDGTNPLCSHYLLGSVLSFLLRSDICSGSYLSLCSVWYHIFDLCLLFAGVWKSTTMSCQRQWFAFCRGRRKRADFTASGVKNSVSRGCFIIWRIFGGWHFQTDKMLEILTNFC